MIVGATARDILLTHVFNLPSSRATRDLDLAVAVESWEQFERIKSVLTEQACFQPTPINHRLYFASEGQHAYPLDFVPFGPIAQEANTIVWPPDMSIVMNVAGYEEAYSCAESVQLQPQFEIKVASLAGLAILKMVAWLDRGRTESKDAQDLYFIMTRYADAGNMDRLFGPELGLLESAEFDLDLAACQLLGQDVARLAKPATYALLRAIRDKHHKRMAVDMMGTTSTSANVEAKLQRRLQHFWRGLTI